MTEQTQPTDAELEACPFCGNANAIVYDDLLTFHAGCLSCGSTGSVSSYRNGAIAAWNRRAVLAKWGTPAGAGQPLTDSYVQMVPDKCDRIVWRNHYYHLPPATQHTQAQAGAVPLTGNAVNPCKHSILPFGAEEPFYRCRHCGYVSMKSEEFT